jgi:hypothetical protein
MNPPGHHLQTISELLKSSETTSSTDSYEGADSRDGTDFFRLNDLEALQCFLGTSDYLLKASDSDSDGGRYDPSRECFMCDGEHLMGASDESEDLENQGDHTLVDATAHATARARGIVVPPPMAP